MADPLSIAASVAGLLSVAGKISTVITSFVLSVTDVPDSARTALFAVDGMRLVLSSIRQLLDRLSEMRRDRKEMIHITHLVVVFRETILSLSALEAIVCPAAGNGAKPSKWDRAKWLLEEEKISRAVQSLESHRALLSTMLNILQW